MASRLSLSVIAILVGAFGLTLCGPPRPVVAKVEVPPYVTVTADDATVKEDGAWRIISNAGGAAETPRFGHAPHPLF